MTDLRSTDLDDDILIQSHIFIINLNLWPMLRANSVITFEFSKNKPDSKYLHRCFNEQYVLEM